MQAFGDRYIQNSQHLLGICIHLKAAALVQITPPLPRLHRSVVPWLLAFLTRPLSDSGGEADGPSFLCTNQGGICSLTDTSPLTWVSSHIHYSSSAR